MRAAAGGKAAPQLTSLLDRAAPVNDDAERAVLGACMLEADRVDEIGDLLKPGHFRDPLHGMAWSAILELREAGGERIDQIQLCAKLALTEPSAVSKVVGLTMSVPTGSNALYYAKIVSGLAKIRAALEATEKARQRLYGHGNDYSLACSDAAAIMERAAQDADSEGDWQTGGELKAAVASQYETAKAWEKAQVSTGFDNLDAMTDGLTPGELMLVAARPSMGKSTFLWNMARVMLRMGLGVAIFSVEMRPQQIMRKMACAEAGIDDGLARRGRLGEEAELDFELALRAVADWPLVIGDWPSINLQQLRVRARRAVKKHGSRAIFVDYLQLISGGVEVERRELEVAMVARGLKAMARELNVPVVCAAQLNRLTVGRADKRPMLSDLRESGSLEQDADTVLTIHRPGYYEKGQDPQLTEVAVAKQRDGQTGTCYFTFDMPRARFSERERPVEQATRRGREDWRDR